MRLDPLDSVVRRPWRDVELPPPAVGIPTMLSKTERKLLYGLARDYVRDDAAIVDAGCFLGGSTAAVLAGLSDRETRWAGPPVASYDLFRVEAYTLPKFFADDPSVAVGDSFRDRFDANVASFDVPHVVHEGDITQIGWPGGPIEVLFLDVLKSWEINDAVLRDFFPALVPGRSVIVHQDYAGGLHPWIAITVELMRDSLVLVDWMEWGTHVFFLEGEVPPQLVDDGLRGVPVDERFDLIDRVIRRSDGWVRGMMEIARAQLVFERDGPEAGAIELDAIRDRHREHGVVQSSLNEARLAMRVPVYAGSSRPRGRLLLRKLRTRLAARN
jgi:hypothetical protein